MDREELVSTYRSYIACLNERNFAELSRFVDNDVSHNGTRLAVAGYRGMLEKDVRAIPDLHFEIELLVSDPPYIACRLRFDCTPKRQFLGLPVNGRKVSFTENVFYEFRGEKIHRVWSVIDKAAIESQIQLIAG